MRNRCWVLGAAMVVVVSACEGPEGPAGPAGADGATGPAGVDGATGPAGANGQNGATGDDGQDGLDGANGLDGWDAHQGDAPWGIDLTIVSVTGGTGAQGQFEIGDVPVVTFTVVDDDGIPYDLGELSLRFQLSGPTEHYQVAVNFDQLDPVNQSIWDPVGETWTYTFEAPIPAVYETPPNDTIDLDAEDGDWGGLALVDGTYTLGAWAFRRVSRLDGSTYNEADDETLDVLVGSATVLEPRSVVLEDNCAACHGDGDEGLFAHGGSRRGLGLCLLCHVAGAEDRYSVTDPLVTPAVTIQMSTMVHKIHMGEELTNGFLVTGFPGDPNGEGFPNYNLHDFGEVVFPQWPNGPAECAACHDGATDLDPNGTPSRAACGSCHDDIDWTTGTNHDGGYQVSDANCPVCHLPSEVAVEHDDPRSDPALGNTGLVIDVIGVTGGTGAEGQLLSGDAITIEYTLADLDGVPLLPSDLASATAIFSGPTDHMQWILESLTGNVVATSVDSGNGTWLYTFVSTVPDTYPPQKNDTADIGVEQGDWGGLPLVSGTYRVALNGYRNVVDADLITQREPDADVFDFLVGDATILGTHEVVEEGACLACHDRMEFHGAGRQSVNYCLMCHTAGGEDRNSTLNPASTPGATIHFQTMIHRIHMGTGLTESFDLVGFGDVNHNFNDVVFPRFDGGVQECTACHGSSDAWLDPQASACTSCHDSTDAAAHAAINTDPVFGESCDVCHDVGSSEAVDVVHDWLR